MQKTSIKLRKVGHTTCDSYRLEFIRPQMEQMAIECGTQQQQFMLQDSTKGDNSHANCERSYLMF
jgi:hypothetical protein